MEESKEVPFQEVTIIITNHALDRFLERWVAYLPDSAKPKKPLQTLASFLGRAVPSDLPPRERVKRILNNNFRNDALYFECDGLRFVAVKEEGKYILLTVERIQKR